MTGRGELRRVGGECSELLAELRGTASSTQPWRPQDFHGLLAQGTVRCFLLIDEDQDGIEGPVGYCLFSSSGPEAEIYDLAVLPPFRSAGRGKLLLLAAVVTARAAGASSLHLEVDENNTAARRLYERTGFKIVGRRKGYYRHKDGSVTDALVMRLDLS